MNYQYDDIEDFLMDLSFRNYCLHSSETDVLLWDTWIASNPGKYLEIQQAKQLFILLNGNNTSDQFMRDQQAFVSTLINHLRKEKYSNNSKIKSRADAVPLTGPQKKHLSPNKN